MAAVPRIISQPANGQLTAVFSDIHSNLEALDAVLADIRRRRISRLFCLGDVVGYAADPAACLERVRESRARLVMGNHDEAVAMENEFTDFEGVSETAAAGFLYSRSALKAADLAFLRGLPMVRRAPGCQFVHASLDDPRSWHYIDSDEEAIHHFEHQSAGVAFCGHTHVPMVVVNGPRRLIAAHGHGTIQLTRDVPCLVNVGSVGQPRDGNPLACYVVFDPEHLTVEFCRVPYDMATTMRKIREAGLPAFTARRLKKAT
ncbi:MAG: metallophosphoesterase family protein [Terrimicrobiaceae bacterium]